MELDEVQALIDGIANALQPVVLLAGRIESAAGRMDQLAAMTEKDAAELSSHLRRAVDALGRLRERHMRGDTSEDDPRRI